MQLRDGGTYRSRDGESVVTVKKDVSNGTNYTFSSVDANDTVQLYLESGHYLSAKLESVFDLIEEIY